MIRDFDKIAEIVIKMSKDVDYIKKSFVVSIIKWIGFTSVGAGLTAFIVHLMK